MNIYYVYAYLRKDGTPYYIGKGKENRAYVRHTTINNPSDHSRIILVEEDLSEEDAHKLEIELIAKYGRKDLGTGILRNLTNGGEGCSGRICSHDTKNKIGSKNSESLRGRKLSTTHKQNIGLSSSNRTEETLRKLGDSQRGEKHWSKKESNKDKKLFNGINPMRDENYVRNVFGPNGKFRKSLFSDESIAKRSGEKHWKYDDSIYKFINIDTGEIIQRTYSEFRREFKCGGNLTAHLNGERSHVKRWRIVK